VTTGPRSAEPSASDSPSPPSTPRAYYALLGAHRAGLADWATIQRCASRFPTHAGLGPDRATHANQMRPLPGDQWLDLDDTAAAELGGRSPTGTRPALLTPWPRKGRLRTTQL
jgi:hypothetical protein